MITSRKFRGYCEECKKSLCEEHSYSYVDGNNSAITRNAPYLCKDCYEKKYKTKILSKVDIFKNNLIDNLFRIKSQNGIESIKINNLIEYIKNL